MENFSYTSYAESGESSPRSRDVDFENPQPWEDQSAAAPTTNYKVKVMCSYGGKIHPRPHDNQLSYVGGETKILAVERSVKFGAVMAKLTALCDGEVCFKYQLPGEDLDALISVTNDDDLEHMMHEYDRLNRASPSPARLRLFLFPVSGQSPALTPVHSFGSTEGRSDRERFMDALNSGTHHVQSSTPPAPAPHGNVDLMFGSDKGMPPPQPSRTRDHHHHTADPQIHQQDQEIAVLDQQVDQIQKHIQDLQRLRIAEEQQLPALYRKPSDDNLAAAGYTGDYYAPKMTEKVAPTTLPGTVPVPVPAPATGYQISGGFPPPTLSQDQQPVYMIQTPASMYHAPPAVNHGQGYYVQRMPTEPVYNVMPPVQQHVATQQTTVSTQQQFLPQKVATYTEGYRVVQSTTGGADHGYNQVAYENGTGRPIYYTNQGAVAVVAQPQPPQQAQPPLQPTAQQYQAMVALNQEGGGGGKVAPVNMKEFM